MKLIDCDLAEKPIAQFKIAGKVYDITPPTVQKKIDYWVTFDDKRKELDDLMKSATPKEFFEAQHRSQIWEIKHFFPFLSDDEIAQLSERQMGKLVATALYGSVPREEDEEAEPSVEKKTKKGKK